MRALPEDHEALPAERDGSSDVYNWYGMTVAYSMVDALRHAGRNLDAREPAPARPRT